MSRLNAKRALVLTGVGLAAAVAAAHASDARLAKASDWLGHAVTTRDGKDLGTVRDLGIDERNGKVVYIVVSVGSFLIENNLIAVAPDALVRSRTEDGVLLLEADPKTLREAKRFASDSPWPTVADVIHGDAGPNTEPPEPAATEPVATNAPAPTGTATIESRSKTAHLSANERVITENPTAVAQPPASSPPEGAQKGASAQSAATAPRLPPITVFDRLDNDGDGVLNRSEFAHVISPKDSYSKIDANANGVIDPDEFDVYEQAHGHTN
jgi:sporulation protein YlmC with PRC-barrel domain